MMGPDRVILRLPGAVPTRVLAATRISDAIAEAVLQDGRSGTILSVHASAVNIRWGDRLLILAHESVGGLPNGVLLASPPPLDRIGLTEGMLVRIDGGNLALPEASLVVGLAGAVWWSPSLPPIRVRSPRSRAARAQRALQVAAAAAPRVGFGPLIAALAGGESLSPSLASTAAARTLAIVGALADETPDRAITAALPLIGLGPGATPSGDDLLVGLAAGLAISGHPLARPFAAGVASMARGRTTALAESFLLHAGDLEFAERVQRVAVALVGEAHGEMRSAINATLAWGASSGADLLVGLLVGVQADSASLARRLRESSDRGAAAA